MPKELKWVLIIAVGVFVGIFAYDRYLTYQAEKALQEFSNSMNSVLQAQTAQTQKILQASKARAQELERQRQASEVRRQKLEFEKTTACGINEDEGTCKCINMETGAKVSVAYQECTRRAREITW